MHTLASEQFLLDTLSRGRGTNAMDKREHLQEVYQVMTIMKRQLRHTMQTSCRFLLLSAVALLSRTLGHEEAQQLTLSSLTLKRAGWVLSPGTKAPSPPCTGIYIPFINSLITLVNRKMYKNVNASRLFLCNTSHKYSKQLCNELNIYFCQDKSHEKKRLSCLPRQPCLPQCLTLIAFNKYLFRLACSIMDNNIEQLQTCSSCFRTQEL